jgi:hypothetical protein
VDSDWRIGEFCGLVGTIDKDDPVTSLSSGGPEKGRTANSSQMGVRSQHDGNVEASQSSVEGGFAGGSVLEEGKEGHRESSQVVAEATDPWTLGPPQINQACRLHGTTTHLTR